MQEGTHTVVMGLVRVLVISAEYAGGDDDHGVPDEDEDGGHDLAEGGGGDDVAVADGGHGDDGPVHGFGHGVEVCLGCRRWFRRRA